MRGLDRMLIVAVIVCVLVFFHMLFLFIRFLLRDNNYNQNIWVHGGQNVGEDRAEMNGLLLYGPGNQADTLVRQRPRERVTSSFSSVYICLIRESTGEYYDTYLEYQLEIGRVPGRSGCRELLIDDPMVSRRHCLCTGKGSRS